MKCFKSALIYSPEGVIKGDLQFDERITGYAGGGEHIDLPENSIVLPGFIDCHIHGAGGADTMDASAESLDKISYTLAREGVTSFLATTMTESEERIAAALEAVAAYKKQGASVGARLLGVHLEGPFISEAYKGAQCADYIKLPEIGLFERFNGLSGKAIKKVTVAPEMAGALKLIGYLKENNIISSIGHSAATESDVAAAVAAGATGVTHTFNAQSPFKHREIGVAGSALLYDGLACELIADCVHVSVSAMKLLFKNKPSDKVILITDALRAKGLGDGESELGGQRVFIENGQARLADGTLAGSVLTMNCAVKNIIEYVGLTFEQAVDCATANPAKALGIFDEAGSIEKGKRADFCIVDKSLNVLMTIVGGEIKYKNF